MSSVERAVITYGTSAIAFDVRRSARRRTVSIAVTPENAVVVTAPKTVNIARLESVVHAKAPWVLERLKRRSDLPPPLPTREFVSGETFLYLGKQYRLELDRGAPVARVELRGDRLYLPVPRDLEPEHERTYSRAALTDWYLARAKTLLPRAVQRWAERLGHHPSRVLVTSASKRWGSVAKDGTLRLNWRIVQAPRPLIDYVVVHELVHLVHFDHGPAFWREVERALPHFETPRSRLRVLGASLSW